MGLTEVPVVPVFTTGILESGVFPDDEEGMTVVRDVPTLMLDPPWDDLDDALGVSGVSSSDYSLSFGEDCLVLSVSLHDPYLQFMVMLDLPEHDDFEEQVRESKMCVIATTANPDRLMLLTFDSK